MGTRVKGLCVPAGVAVAVDGLSLHFDAAHWGPVDPNRFYPLRFDKEAARHRSPLVYMPFGIGVRNW